MRNELEELKQDLDSGTGFAARGETQPARARSMKSAVIAGTITLIVAAAATYAWWRLPRSDAGALPGGSRVFTQLTKFAGREQFPSLSPDAKWVVYEGNQTGNADIYLQSVGGQNPINLTADSPDDDTQPAFSRDGERIAFRSEREGGGLFVMGRTGESARRISSNGYTPAWSPDGTRLVFGTDAAEPFWSEP